MIATNRHTQLSPSDSGRGGTCALRLSRHETTKQPPTCTAYVCEPPCARCSSLARASLCALVLVLARSPESCAGSCASHSCVGPASMHAHKVAGEHGKSSRSYGWQSRRPQVPLPASSTGTEDRVLWDCPYATGHVQDSTNLSTITSPNRPVPFLPTNQVLRMQPTHAASKEQAPADSVVTHRLTNACFVHASKASHHLTSSAMSSNWEASCFLGLAAVGVVGVTAPVGEDKPEVPAPSSRSTRSCRTDDERRWICTEATGNTKRRLDESAFQHDGQATMYAPWHVPLLNKLALHSGSDADATLQACSRSEPHSDCFDQAL